MPGDNSFDREDILPPLERQYLEDVENPHDSRDYQEERRRYEQELQRERGEKPTTSSFRRYNNSSGFVSNRSYFAESAQPGAGGEQNVQTGQDANDDDMDKLFYEQWAIAAQPFNLFRVYLNNSNWF